MKGFLKNGIAVFVLLNGVAFAADSLQTQWKIATDKVMAACVQYDSFRKATKLKLLKRIQKGEELDSDYIDSVFREEFERLGIEEKMQKAIDLTQELMSQNSIQPKHIKRMNQITKICEGKPTPVVIQSKDAL